MKNKIVIFSNIKGGVGKTTLCALFASYLVERGYPVMAIDATGIFVKALKTVSAADLVFLPNRINTSEKKSEELRQRAQTTEFLGLVGTVMPTVKQSVAVKRYTTLYPLEKSQLAAVEPSFDKIIEVLHLNE